jgi:hypothetical protein
MMLRAGASFVSTGVGAVTAASVVVAGAGMLATASDSPAVAEHCQNLVMFPYSPGTSVSPGARVISHPIGCAHFNGRC